MERDEFEGYEGDGHEGEEPEGREPEPVDEQVAEAYDAGVADARLAAQDDAELTQAADALEARWPELADEEVQDELFAAMQRAGIEPGSNAGLQYVEQWAGRRYLDRSDPGDRIVSAATRTRFRLGR